MILQPVEGYAIQTITTFMGMMDIYICNICGAGTIDTSLHSQYHFDLGSTLRSLHQHSHHDGLLA